MAEEGGIVPGVRFAGLGEGGEGGLEQLVQTGDAGGEEEELASVDLDEVGHHRREVALPTRDSIQLALHRAPHLGRHQLVVYLSHKHTHTRS